MLTIFACPKPFTDPHIAIIQRNAITSWTLLRPRPEIILFGGEPYEPGVAEICRELGLRHVPEVARNEYGTPLLNDIFNTAQRLATYDLMCYANADMILMEDLVKAIESVKRCSRPFLLSGGRWELEIGRLLDFSQQGWQQQLLTLVSDNGQHRFFGNDYFVFPRGLYATLPPFAVGRGYFDGWLIWKARSLKSLVIDASSAVKAVHQNHDYSHVGAKDSAALWGSPEAQLNLELLSLPRQWLLLEATHVLTPDGLRRTWGRKLKCRMKELVIYGLGPIRHALGMRRASLAAIKQLFR